MQDIYFVLAQKQKNTKKHLTNGQENGTIECVRRWYGSVGRAVDS